MKYYILTDEKFGGEIFRYNDGTYERFVYGPNTWIESNLFNKYLDEKSSVFNMFDEIEEKKIVDILAKQIEKYERLWNVAYKFANRVHEGTRDRNGVDYIQHPIYVANQFEIYDFKIVGILHDVVENTSTKLEDLEKCGFPPKIINAIEAITRRDGEDYFDYLERLKHNYIDRKVNIEDVKHNLQEDRLKNLHNKEALRKKYERAYEMLIQ